MLHPYEESLSFPARLLLFDERAQSNAFADYRARLSPRTKLRQQGDLVCFCCFLCTQGLSLDPIELASAPAAWMDLSYGIVRAFVAWMLDSGYAMATVNARLCTVKTYLRLSGTLPGASVPLVEAVHGYGYRHGANVDATRPVTRRGYKKEQAVGLSARAIWALKFTHPDTPQGRRDALLFCLLLDHGLRCGEVAGLQTKNIEQDSGVLTFYREKVKLTQKHRLTADTRLALARYLDVCVPGQSLLLGSRRGDDHLLGRMSQRSITRRVQVIAERVLGIPNCSAHDCRHAWVERALAGGTGIRALQEAGGWSSPAMPLAYARAATIANEGVILG